MKEYDNILVAIHGIGAQSRNSTVRYVANRMALSSALRQPNTAPPLAPQPLGYFYPEVKDITKISPLDTFEKGRSDFLARTGFTEVFWADIPQEVVKEGRTLEETKAWARTVVARAHASYNKHQHDKSLSEAERLRLENPDFHLAAEVVEEIIDTVYVLQNLTFLGEKAGLMKFDLAEVLAEYVGDVQIVTEFQQFRASIVGRFHDAMEKISARYPDANLHIVAHSEGTVVSFLGLLHALSAQELIPAGAGEQKEPLIKKNDGPPPWLEKVRGYMTIGSPIDKHILMWPKIFDVFDFEAASKPATAAGRIHWRNYYDYGDPVGFKLDTARRWLELKGCHAFEFEAKPHDIGFARYLMPGKAHNDYWEDADVFEHFVRDVIKGEGTEAPKPATRPLVYFVSPLLPYLISFAVLVAATFLLYRAVSGYLHPELDPLQRYIRVTQLGIVDADGAVSGPRMFLHSIGVAALIAGVTAIARVPRLATGKLWYLIGLIAYALGAVLYWRLVVPHSRDDIGFVFSNFGANGPTLGVLALGLLVGHIGLLVKLPSHETRDPDAVPRKQRWILKGMRPLILCGALGIFLLIGAQIWPEWFGKRVDLKLEQNAHLNPGQIKAITDAKLSPADINGLLGAPDHLDQRLKFLQQLTPGHPPVWPVLLSGAAFLYLWWLAALIFDLAFVWQRYVRNSVSNKRLMRWLGYARTSESATG